MRLWAADYTDDGNCIVNINALTHPAIRWLTRGVRFEISFITRCHLAVHRDETTNLEAFGKVRDFDRLNVLYRPDHCAPLWKRSRETTRLDLGSRLRAGVLNIRHMGQLQARTMLCSVKGFRYRSVESFAAVSSVICARARREAIITSSEVL